MKEEMLKLYYDLKSEDRRVVDTAEKRIFELSYHTHKFSPEVHAILLAGLPVKTYLCSGDECRVTTIYADGPFHQERYVECRLKEFINILNMYEEGNKTWSLPEEIYVRLIIKFKELLGQAIGPIDLYNKSQDFQNLHFISLDKKIYELVEDKLLRIHIISFLIARYGGNDECIDILNQELNSGDRRVAQAASEALSAIEPKYLLTKSTDLDKLLSERPLNFDSVAKFLYHPNYEIRHKTINAMIETDDKIAVEYLKYRLDSFDAAIILDAIIKIDASREKEMLKVTMYTIKNRISSIHYGYSFSYMLEFYQKLINLAYRIFPRLIELKEREAILEYLRTNFVQIKEEAYGMFGPTYTQFNIYHFVSILRRHYFITLIKEYYKYTNKREYTEELIKWMNIPNNRLERGNAQEQLAKIADRDVIKLLVEKAPEYVGIVLNHAIFPTYHLKNPDRQLTCFNSLNVPLANEAIGLITQHLDVKALFEKIDSKIKELQEKGLSLDYELNQIPDEKRVMLKHEFGAELIKQVREWQKQDKNSGQTSSEARNRMIGDDLSRREITPYQASKMLRLEKKLRQTMLMSMP